MTAAVPSIDPARAELRGPLAAMRALLDGGEAPPAAGAVPLLAAGLEAARTPATRWRVTGLPAGVEAVADARAALLLAEHGPDGAIVRACTPSGLLGLLAAAVGLGPRPCPGDAPRLELPVAAMARLLGTRSPAAAGLPDAEARRWRPVLDAATAHWRMEVRRAAGPSGGWYLEVVDTAVGLWAVEAAGPLVRLVPTGATAVLDELAALPARVGAAVPDADRAPTFAPPSSPGIR